MIISSSESEVSHSCKEKEVLVTVVISNPKVFRSHYSEEGPYPKNEENQPVENTNNEATNKV